MKQHAMINELYDRARINRVRMYVICKRAGVNKSTPSKWRNGHSEPLLSTVTALNNALDEIINEAAAAANKGN